MKVVVAWQSSAQQTGEAVVTELRRRGIEVIDDVTVRPRYTQEEMRELGLVVVLLTSVPVVERTFPLAVVEGAGSKGLVVALDDEAKWEQLPTYARYNVFGPGNDPVKEIAEEVVRRLGRPPVLEPKPSGWSFIAPFVGSIVAVVAIGIGVLYGGLWPGSKSVSPVPVFDLRADPDHSNFSDPRAARLPDVALPDGWVGFDVPKHMTQGNRVDVQVATGDSAVYCSCPSGYTCSQVVPAIAPNDPRAGAYCIKTGTAFDPSNACYAQCDPLLKNCG
jgi:hypothetical protein